MRALLLFMGWSSVMGSLADGSIGLYAPWLAGVDRWTDIGMTVDELLRRLLFFLHCMTQLTLYVLPQDVPPVCFRYRTLCTFQSESMTVRAVIGARYLNPGHASEAIPQRGERPAAVGVPQ